MRMPSNDLSGAVWRSLSRYLEARPSGTDLAFEADWLPVQREVCRTLAELGVIGIDIAANLNPDRVFESFHHFAGRMLNMQHLAIYRLAAERGELHQVFARECGDTLPRIAPIPIDDPHSFCAQVARTRQAIVVDNANEQAAAAHVPGTLWMRSLLFFPLAAGDKLLGVISIQSTEPNAFGQRERFICRTLAAYGAIALENADAYRRLDEATTELDRTNRSLLAQRDELDRASRAKTALFAAASHDLRQPMQALSLLVDCLEQRNADGTRADDVTRSIRSAVQSMLELFDALMDISKFDAGVVKPQLADVNIARHLERIEADYAHQVEPDRVRFRVRPCSAIVRTDPILLHRILTNLVSNAVRYTPAGRILVGCRRCSGGIRVEVWDTGYGIPLDRLGDIFREYVRLEPAAQDVLPKSGSHVLRRQNTLGRGLGLAIVQRAAKLLDLRVNVRSVPGKGSVFSVEIPYGTMPAPAQHPAAFEGTAGQLTGRHILVIDDDQEILDAMTHLLKSWGCSVLHAKSGAHALAVLRASEPRPDAVISDFRLGNGASGLDAVAALHGEFGFLPTIFVSGDTAQQVREAVEKSGHRLLCKPVAPARLRSLLSNLLTDE
jgi:signal transduction histidine kinase